MKYKVGDKVKIKTWEAMKKEYSVSNKKFDLKYIFTTPNFTYRMEKDLNIDRTIIIRIMYKKNNSYCYSMEGSGYMWSDEMIECLDSEYKEPIPVLSRFELLDL